MTDEARPQTIELAARRWVPAIFSYIGSTAAMAIGIVAQLVAFVFLARYLGIEQFGLLMTITAATSLALNVCGLGAGEAFMRRVGREPAISIRCSASSDSHAATGAALSVVTVVGLYCPRRLRRPRSGTS